MITDYSIIVVRVRVTMERRTAVGGESIIMYCTADISVTVSSPSLLVEAGQVGQVPILVVSGHQGLCLHAPRHHQHLSQLDTARSPGVVFSS